MSFHTAKVVNIEFFGFPDLISCHAYSVLTDASLRLNSGFCSKTPSRASQRGNEQHQFSAPLPCVSSATQCQVARAWDDNLTP